MVLLREWVALVFFCAACAGVYSLYAEGYEWPLLFAVILSFAAAHFVWPSKRKGQRFDGGTIADIAEFFIELPVDIFSWLIKLLGRGFGGKGGVDDFDIDV